MAEMIMDGLGSANNAIVDDSHRLWTHVSGIVGVSGMVNDWTLNLIQRMDYQDEMQPIYLGLALPGTATSAATWQIRKMEYSGTNSYSQLPTAVLFGSGNVNFDKEWDNRSGIYEAYS